MAKNLSKKSSQKAGSNATLSSTEKVESCEEGKQYLKGVKAVIIEQGLGKTRASILLKQLGRHGGEAGTKLSQNTTHILVGNCIKFAKLAGILKVKEISEKIKVLRADWLSSCLKEGKIVDLKPFSLRENDAGQVTVNAETESPSCKTQGKQSIDAFDELPCTDSKGIDSCVPSDGELPTTSKDGGVGSKRRKIGEDDDGSDYLDSDDDTEEGGASSDDSRRTKPTEISPHISPHKKVER